MKRYETYKDSGVEWIGEIPAHWEVKSGISLFDIKKDAITKEEMNGKIVFHYSIPNVQEYGDGALEDGNGIDSNKFVVHGSELLYSKLNPRKETIVITKEKNLLQVCSTEFLVIKPKAYTLKFIFFLFRSYFLKEEISSTVQSSTKSHQRANPGEIHRLKYPLPPIAEQEFIAHFLDRKTSQIDNLVKKKKRLIELLKEEKVAVINQAVTKGMDPNVKMKDSGIELLGEVPEHWEVKKLKWVAELISGVSFNSSDFSKSGDIRVLKISNVQHDYFDWTETEYLPDTFAEIFKKFRIINGDIIFALTRPIISTGIKSARAILDERDVILLNQRNAILRVTEKIDGSFMYCITHSNYFYTMFELGIDNTGLQPNISSNSILNFNLLLPPLGEQLLINEFIQFKTSQIDKTIFKIEKEIELLLEYRTALISEVVTGKVRLGENIKTNSGSQLIS